MNLLCQGCGATLVMEPQLRTATCPYCESPQVVERPADPNRPNPVFALGFLLGKEEAHQRVRLWLKRRTFFARSGIHAAKLEDVRGVYLPTYLYGATARADYTAEIGENYTETTTVGSGKNRRTVTRVKTEWRTLAGSFAAYVSDVLVTASKGLPNAQLQAVEPFDLRQMTRFSPALISGWVAEEPSLTPNECLALAREEARAAMGQRLAAFMPGDSHQNLRFNTALDTESLDLLLAPVWLFAARYDAKRPPMRVVINGQTGAIHGKVPLSWVKISAAVLAALVAVLIAVLLLKGQGR